ncbi:MAG TPA: GNAT family N-acetyltransferase [Bacteroidales bacterium]|jgi:ribosomal protein S18 acetylase RimI-like enzyme|nr:GNAT family N-acetyltransferase [Bacteroidales bacterium]
MTKTTTDSPPAGLRIREIRRFGENIYKAVIRLVPQLNPDKAPPTREHIKGIIRSKNTRLFVAEVKEGNIAGLFTLVTYDIPTGKKFWIEDVVVDESERGKGIGKEMMLFAIGFAKSAGAVDIDLTSRPERIAANILYQKLGFIRRETNAYRYKIA